MKSKASILHLEDIWVAYSFTLLAANPTWVGITYNKIPNYYLYCKYVDEKGKAKVETMFDYGEFRKIIETYFELAKDAIIRGECVDMTSGIGKICARRVQRNHAYKTINFAKTKEQPKIWSDTHGKMIRKKLIYYTSDDWCRIGWHKFGRLRNETMYDFTITKNSRDGTGFNQQLDKALKTNPLLKYKYIYYPLNTQ